VKRSCNGGVKYAESESSDSSSDFEDEEGVDGELWPQSGVHSIAYRRRMSIWKNEFKGKGQVFASAEVVRCSIWGMRLQISLNTCFSGFASSELQLSARLMNVRFTYV